MTAFNGKIFLILSMMMALAWAQQTFNQYSSDGEVPSVLSYNSPLRQPDSLRSRPYFDFLSTLYRRDSDKTPLFRPYLTRTRREAVDPATLPIEIANYFKPTSDSDRSRRAIVFRPLFVYKQQEIRKQQIQDQRKRH